MFVTLWATLFVIFWKRRCRGLYIEWDNHTTIYQDDDVRKEFQGVVRVNPVTDRVEPTFFFTERLARYGKSFLICLPHFLFVVVFNIVFLNLTGIVDPARHHALFQIEFLSDLCKEGAVFDTQSNMALVPTIVQVLISIVADLKFKSVANHATEVENHRTQTDFNNSLIIKRFAFMFCDYFLYLFYIGIYELRIDLLRTNLGFLFMIDEFRRILIETIIPYLQVRSGKKDKKDKPDKDSAAYIEAKEDEELELSEYETFDDYLEMIITFGYVTLFAGKTLRSSHSCVAAFPLASFISMVFIYFESRSDLYKLEKLKRRPRVTKAHDIGSWVYVLEFMAVTSVFTNIVLFTFASDQIDYLLPFLKKYRDDSV